MSALFAFSMHGEGQADAPEWDVGDQWSMGYEIDIGETFGPLLDVYGVLSGEFDSFDSELEGKAGYYMIFKITGETDTEYTMDITSGGGIDLDANVQITGDMPKEGTYTYDDWDFEPPMESKEVSIDVVLDVSLKADGTAHFTKDGLKLKDLEMEMSLVGSGDVEILNFPETDYDYDEETYEEIMTVGYSDYDVSGSADIKLTLSMDFDPPLDIFNFPIEENEEWVAESNVTVSGTYQGTIDADGLPEELLTDMLEDDIAFPIIFEELDTGSEEIKDGVIQEQTFPLSIPIMCTGTEMVALADGSSSEAYVIQLGEEEYEDPYDDYLLDDDDYLFEEEQSSGLSGMKFLYCPEEGFFVSVKIESLGEDLGMDGLPGSLDSLEFGPMSTDDAEKNIGTYDKEGSNDDGIGLLVWILVAAAVLVLIIIGVLVIVLLVRKK
ncbi:MAG: hypothetical protein JW939_04610 [Candidatus Thermoplasmatota archaeon]|nr:hypothetical protein [Candidatus Thermoplasmatota archaeon]